MGCSLDQGQQGFYLDEMEVVQREIPHILIMKKGSFYIEVFNDSADLDWFVDVSSLLKHRPTYWYYIKKTLCYQKC